MALYGELMECTPSPVVELNRAVAVSMASGPAAALLLVDGLVADGHLARYHLLHAARGDLLARLDRRDEARAEFERAAAMTANEREKALLLERARGSARAASACAARQGDALQLAGRARAGLPARRSATFIALRICCHRQVAHLRGHRPQVAERILHAGRSARPRTCR